MEAISNADRFVALLRQKLAERSRAKGSERKRRHAETIAGQPREPARQRALVEQPVKGQRRRQGAQKALGQPLASIGRGD